MSDFYRFPAMEQLNEFTDADQLAHIQSEVTEAFILHERWAITAIVTNDDDMTKCDRNLYGMELMDVIHSTETALRKEFSPEEVAQLRDAVIEKNRKRGYYGD